MVVKESHIYEHALLVIHRLFLAALRLGLQLYRCVFVFAPAQQRAHGIACGNPDRMQQRAIQSLAENKDAVVGAARRGPAAFVPGGRADEIKFAQPALRRLAENFIDQQLSWTVTAKSLVISGLGQKIPAA